MEARLFAEGTVPEYATPGWYAGRDAAPHLEQAGHRERLMAAVDLVDEALVWGGAATVVDLGAGDGGLLSALNARHPHLKTWGYDLQPTNVAAAHTRGARVSLLDVVTEPWEPADVTVCTEMLEHLIDPHALVARIGSPWMVASSPYTETAESHYGFHLWAWDEDGYQRMLTDAGWRIVTTTRAWICQIVLAARDDT